MNKRRAIALVVALLTILLGLMYSPEVASHEKKGIDTAGQPYLKQVTIVPKQPSHIFASKVAIKPTRTQTTNQGSNSPQNLSCERVEAEKIKDYAYKRVLEVWGGSQWYWFNDLVMRESGWNNCAKNPKSTAFGTMQFLDGTWQGTGYTKTSDPYQQLEAGFIYIQNRYGTPSGAVYFHNINNWY